MKKNDWIELDIDDLGTDGQGIGHKDGAAVFVDGALPGERVRAKVIALKKNYVVGKLEEILSALSLIHISLYFIMSFLPSILFTATSASR